MYHKAFEYLSSTVLNTILCVVMQEEQAQTSETREDLRLFPLNVVLFPGIALPLRIFEERYKLMIGECLEAGAPFGVVMIKEGREVGAGATPHEIGTTARITNVERLEGGRLNLATAGERRFRIVDTVQEQPYLKAIVELLPEETGDLTEATLDRAKELFSEYARSLAGLQGGWTREAKIPQEPGQLSYSIAHYLDLPAMAKQRFLELPVTGERLHYEIPLLEGANKRIKEELVKRSPYKGPWLN